MALIKLTAFMDAISGKVNGTVFSRNKGGAYAKGFVVPSNPQSAGQSVVRSRFGNLSIGWKALTQTQRDTWIAAAPQWLVTNTFADLKQLSGQQLFIRLNCNIIMAGGTQINTAPVPAGLTPLQTFAVGTNTTAAQTFTFSASPVPANIAMIVMATPGLSAGISNITKYLRIFTTVAPAGTSPVNSFAAYVTKFGTPISGGKITWRVFLVSRLTGEVSTFLQFSSVTA